MDRTQLFESLDRLFDDNELQTLCFKLDIDYEGLSGDNKPAKIRELIKYCERNDKTSFLINAVKVAHPNFVRDIATSISETSYASAEHRKDSNMTKFDFVVVGWEHFEGWVRDSHKAHPRLMEWTGLAIMGLIFLGVAELIARLLGVSDSIVLIVLVGLFLLIGKLSERNE